jgi:hypothetical protein
MRSIWSWSWARERSRSASACLRLADSRSREILLAVSRLRALLTAANTIPTASVTRVLIRPKLRAMRAQWAKSRSPIRSAMSGAARVESPDREQGRRAEGRGGETHPHAEQEDCHDGEPQEINLTDRAHGDQEADPESVVEETDHSRSPPERDPVEHKETEHRGQRDRIDRHDGEGALFPQSVHTRHVDQDTQERAHPQHEQEQAGPQVAARAVRRRRAARRTKKARGAPYEEGAPPTRNRSRPRPLHPPHRPPPRRPPRRQQRPKPPTPRPPRAQTRSRSASRPSTTPRRRSRPRSRRPTQSRCRT